MFCCFLFLFLKDHFLQDFNSQVKAKGGCAAVCCEEIEPGSCIFRVSLFKINFFHIFLTEFVSNSAGV